MGGFDTSTLRRTSGPRSRHGVPLETVRNEDGMKAIKTVLVAVGVGIRAAISVVTLGTLSEIE